MKAVNVHAQVEWDPSITTCGMTRVPHERIVDHEQFLTMGDVRGLWLRCEACLRGLFPAMPKPPQH